MASRSIIGAVTVWASFLSSAVGMRPYLLAHDSSAKYRVLLLETLFWYESSSEISGTCVCVALWEVGSTLAIAEISVAWLTFRVRARLLLLGSRRADSKATRLWPPCFLFFFFEF
jgi:hypothetical protein